ncbi:hypothetical protein GCM10009737_11760 [Nocardioides lentus]|uniref:POTRA domain-containing protein n=1 Tax=Nocardioides lentus TaxID=338077 RepID=A0ABN2P515_9ACTN
MARPEERRFSRRRWARRLAAWRTTLALAAVAVVVGVTVWVVGWSQVLAVEGVEVTGADEVLSADGVRAAADVEAGQPLARVDLDRIEARVEALAAVRDADVSRQWPHEVRIEVTEREAVALVRIGDSVRGMDTEGVAFRTYEGRPPDLPRVDTSASVATEALREAAAVVTAMPVGLSEQVESVSVESVDAISLILRDGRTVRWGSAEASGQKAAVLASLLRRDALAFDVSVPGDPTSCADPGCV